MNLTVKAVRQSALTGLHARVLLVDDVDLATATDHTAVLVPNLGRFQAVSDFHDPTLD
ncbi:hypothetical protein SXCC_00925 [Gluconacetobacter sp. SXCC-1]|nr:hypothetical protein SXCC_00925 [Gluconacetobacter sp. SXCC-1]